MMIRMCPMPRACGQAYAAMRVAWEADSTCVGLIHQLQLGIPAPHA
ncbi:MAG: hypothetical protein OXI38_04590 [Bacteroidota bacterium]|nr:hypothetical protein [Bacteroidota bacterium]